MPAVSVIIPVYNGADTLERAVRSAQGQTIRDLEIVVVDDCSTDNSYVLAERLAREDPRIKCTRLPQNGGASVARNTALDLATGTWIAVLDADDWYESNRLEILLAAAREYQADLVCDNLKIFDHALGEIVDETHHGRIGEVTALRADMLFMHDNPLRLHAIGYVKPMVKKSFLQTHGIRYDPVHRNGQDFVFLAEIILSGARAFVVPDATYVYVHRISPTTRKISPHSRSGARFNLIVRGCDQLLLKYGASMDLPSRRALEQRRWIFENRVKCSDMLAAMSEKKFFRAFGILLAYPFIFVLVATTILKWMYNRIRYFIRKRVSS